MSSSRPHSLALTPHPAGMHQMMQDIQAHVTKHSNGYLVLKYTVRGDTRRLGIPPARAPQRADDLWRHTCFEAFIATGAGPSYLELNFSPSGEWASYEFTRYRERRMADRDGSGPVSSLEAGPLGAPSVRTMRDDEELTLEAALTLACLRGENLVKMALAAVIEDSNGNLSYWALWHPPGKPDFHHPDAFALQL